LPAAPKPQSAAQRVDQWAAAQPADVWQRLTLREGEKGLLAADYLHAHVWVWDAEEEQARCWHLLVRREVGANSISHYCLSNAPLDTPWQELARVQAERFFIEHSFREAKSEYGMADYQVRRWERYFWLNRKKRGGNSGPCCHLTIWSQRLSIYSPADNSRLKNWRTLSVSVTIYAEKPRNHTPDGLKWRANESDKVELRKAQKMNRSFLYFYCILIYYLF